MNKAPELNGQSNKNEGFDHWAVYNDYNLEFGIYHRSSTKKVS